MAFGVDYSKANDNGLVPEGEYEVIIKSAGEDTTKNGAYHISVPLVIRNDVEQPRKNAYIWHQIWQKKEPTEADKQCNGFSAAQIQSLSKAAGLPNGKQYESLDDWCKDLTGKTLRVIVKHEEWNGYTNAKVKAINPSKCPNHKHVFKSAADTSGSANTSGGVDDFTEVDDDGDLPF